MSPRIAVVHSVALYDGQRYLGDVAELATGQFAAYGPDADRLGVFDKRADAERLIRARGPASGGGADG